MKAVPDLSAEWLESDGLGGFASGTVGGFRTRRYHALLVDRRRKRRLCTEGSASWAEDSP